MSTYSLTHLSDQILLDGLSALLADDRQTAAALLAYIAEVDARKLYLPAACPSMHAYCVRVLHLAEDAAYKRITVARTARRFPVIFAALADGRLHLSAVGLLVPHLTEDSADELIAAASHRSKAEIALLLAQRYPRPDLPTTLHPLPAPALSVELAPGRVAAAPPPTTTVVPLAPQRFALQLTIDQATQDKLVRAQALLRHQLPSGDLVQVVDRALDALLDDLERKKFAATPRPRAGTARSKARNARHIPNDVKRAVHARDGEQCSFVSEDGERCTSRSFLEFDHVDPVALGGQATVDGTRLLCRAHNQFAAECTFGTDFMQARRAQAAMEADVILGLCGLGWSTADARRAVAQSAHLPATTLEKRLVAALAVLCPRSATRCSDGATVAAWAQLAVGPAPTSRKHCVAALSLPLRLPVDFLVEDSS